MKNKGALILHSIARTLLGLTFIFSGVVKAIDPLGTVYKIEDYLKAFGSFFTDLLPLATPAAWCLIAVEVVLGICLVANVRTRVTMWITLAFYSIMTPLTLYVALTNPVSDCGCFGDALVISNWQTFGKNVILLTLVGVMIGARKGLHSTFLPGAEAVIAGLSLAGVIGLMTWTMYHLPLVDFRPYKVGNYLPEGMEYPEDAEQDVYEIHLVYAKDGVEQAFSLQDYPRNDSSWAFVRQDSKLLHKGYEPPIHDFEIINSDYEDITEDILTSETPVTLAVMYELSKTDMEQAQKLNLIYQQCLRQGQAFYAVTGSNTDEMIAFMLQTGAEYPICTCDPVTLKTIVRANPGVVVIQNGVVIDKYNVRNR